MQPSKKHVSGLAKRVERKALNLQVMGLRPIVGEHIVRSTYMKVVDKNAYLISNGSRLFILLEK